MAKVRIANNDRWFLLWLGAFFISGIIALIYQSNKVDVNTEKKKINTSNQVSDSKPPTPCEGTENCISSVRKNFRNSGKQILGEQYLGRGKFGISFLDPIRGEAFNVDVLTDCNCSVTEVNASKIR